MKQRSQRNRSMDVLFVLVLFLIFTACALAVVLLGAKVYQSTSSRMQDNYTVRTALAYVSEKIRHYDETGVISLRDEEGVTALCFTDEIDGTTYVTRLYFHDRTLKELLIKEEQTFSPDLGNRIVELEDFSIRETAGGFYCLTARDENGEELSLYIRPRSTQEVSHG